MPRDPLVLLFVGIRYTVLALDERTGTEVWSTDLRSGEYVTVLWDGQSLFAANSGEIWRLDPKNGAVLWHNELTGFGRGLVSLASSRRPSEASDMDLAAQKRLRDAQAAAAAVAAS